MLEGLPPNGAAHVMRLRCDAVAARKVADIIVETFDPAETAASAFEEPPGSASWSGGPWIVEVFFGHAPDESRVRALVAAASDETLAASAEFGEVPKRDWVAASLEGLQAVREGRFVIHGAHGRAELRTGDIGIEIEAALAFGTGHHGTTRGCLAELNALAKRRRPVRILDIGTGTGVLAIAAARLFRRRIASGDIDAVAITTARENARRNRVHPQVHPVQAVGLVNPALRAGAPYDLILANILARPLRAMAPAIRDHTASGGEIILSGLIASDVPGVISAYRTQGLILVRRRAIEGWATLLLRRPISSA